MPKTETRIFLKVTGVSVERLQDITEEQAISEGISKLFDHLSDEEYKRWSHNVSLKETKQEQPYCNYLWHGYFGQHGMGNKISDEWAYQDAYDSAKDSFSSMWNSTLPLKKWKDIGWNANPWVWVYEF